MSALEYVCRDRRPSMHTADTDSSAFTPPPTLRLVSLSEGPHWVCKGLRIFVDQLLMDCWLSEAD